MTARAVMIAALTIVLLASMAPAVSAGTRGELRRVDRPSADMLDDLFGAPVRSRADVFNGKPVARGAYPYVGLVLMMDPDVGEVLGQCSGSLIRPRFVLTAGHCTSTAKAAVFIPGVADLRDVQPDDVFVAAAVATAPKYAPRTMSNDVGLLKLSEPVGIRPVRVADAADVKRYGGGTKATVVGWGAVDRRLTMPTRLRSGTITLLSAKACAARWGGQYRPRSMLCGGSRVTDTCVGDSGGPLLVRDKRKRWLLLGTTSFGATACGPNVDSVYARVSSVRGWIERVSGLPEASLTRPWACAGDPVVRWDVLDVRV